MPNNLVNFLFRVAHWFAYPSSASTQSAQPVASLQENSKWSDTTGNQLLSMQHLETHLGSARGTESREGSSSMKALFWKPRRGGGLSHWSQSSIEKDPSTTTSTLESPKPYIPVRERTTSYKYHDPSHGRVEEKNSDA